MGLAWVDLSAGYWRLTGGLFALHVVELDVVADQPDEDLLALYSHHEVRTLRAKRFWGELTGAEAKMEAHETEGFDEEFQRILNSMPIEDRFAGATPEQLLLALPDEALRALSVDYVSHLPPETAAAIRKRLGQA